MNNDAMLEKLCALRGSFDRVMERHINDEGFINAVKAGFREHNVPSVEELRNIYAEETDTARLLRIGIVGRVKAGKSSLLNSLLFGGKDILPKAATPMTAALTYLEYGERISLNVEFFTAKDIEQLRQEAESYEKTLRLKTEEQYTKIKNMLSKNKHARPQSDSDIRKNAETAALNEMKQNIPLSAAYEQYQQMKKAPDRIRSEINLLAAEHTQKSSDSEGSAPSQTIPVNSIQDIASVLSDYVGESGAYMPFTRSVNIKLPLPELQGVTVVDTPGFNDPVPSRNDKARHLLQQCDVVLILSLTNQIMSKNDTEVIEKITKKDGIRELFVVASQFDNALFGQEVIEEADGNIEAAIRFVKMQITGQIKQVLTGINTGDIFTSIITGGEKNIFHSSGICQSMLQTWEEKVQWDGGRKQVWHNLTREYPDYFSDGDAETSKQSLALLGNINPIKQAIENVKMQKDRIFAEKIAGFERKYTANVLASKKELLAYLDARKADIERLNLGTLEKEIAALQNTCGKISDGLKDALWDTFDSWYFKTREDCNTKLGNFFAKAQSGVAAAEKSDVRRWITYRWLFWKEEHSESYTVVNTDSVKNEIELFIDKFNVHVKAFMNNQIKVLAKDAAGQVAHFWDTHFSGNVVDTYEVKNAIRSLVLDSIDTNIEYTGETSFSSLSGTLTYSAAEDFIVQAQGFVKKLQLEFKRIVSDKLEDIFNRLTHADLAGQFIKKYEILINNKKKEAENPKQALEQLSRLKKELETV